MFIFHKHTFDRDLVLTAPVREDLVTAHNVMFYDKDGFELTPLEKRYYDTNNVVLTDMLYNVACHKPWAEQVDHSSGIVLDHSMILQRYSFGGEALEQLKRRVKQIPVLQKLIQTKHKWGIDFSVDYIDEEEVIDVFHLEWDSYSYDEIVEMHEVTTKRFQEIDWVDAAKAIKARKSEWHYLEGHAQSDWKAKFFGFIMSEEICKAF